MWNKFQVFLLVSIAAFVVLLCLFSDYWLEDTKGKISIHSEDYGSSRTGIQLPVVSPAPATKPVSNVSYTGGEVNVGSVSSSGSGLAVPMVRTSAVTTRSYSGGYSLGHTATLASGSQGSGNKRELAVGATSRYMPNYSFYAISARPLAVQTTSAVNQVERLSAPSMHRAPGAMEKDSWETWWKMYVEWNGDSEDLGRLYEWWEKTFGDGFTPDAFYSWEEWVKRTHSSSDMPVGDGIIPLCIMAFVCTIFRTIRRKRILTQKF